jgi:hypothetical protein
VIEKILTTYYLLAFVIFLFNVMFGDLESEMVKLVAGLNVIIFFIVGLGHSIYLIWS